MLDGGFDGTGTFGVGSGAHILVNGLIDVTREMAEARAGVSDA